MHFNAIHVKKDDTSHSLVFVSWNYIINKNPPIISHQLPSVSSAFINIVSSPKYIKLGLRLKKHRAVGKPVYLYHPVASVLWTGSTTQIATVAPHLRDGILQGGNIRSRVLHLRQATLLVFHILEGWEGWFTFHRRWEINVEKLVMFDNNKRKEPRNSWISTCNLTWCSLLRNRKNSSWIWRCSLTLKHIPVRSI